jgi:hypothetical protein
MAARWTRWARKRMANEWCWALFGVASQTAANLPDYVQAHLSDILVIQNAPIPTLSQWAMVLLVSLMGTVGFVRMRRGRRNGFTD